jgi:DNA repair protein RecO (recombination protein O)
VSKVEKTRALLLRRHDFSETSFVVQLFTRDFGMIRALAKGAKRERSPMYGALEPLTLADVVFYYKRPPALHILSQARTEVFFRGLRSELGAFFAAHHLAALLLASMPDELQQEEVFERAVQAFQRMSDGTDPAMISLTFEAVLLRLLGHFPRTDVCVACDKAWEKGEKAVFHAPSGGALHPACARDARGVTVGTGTLQVLRQFGEDRAPRPDRVRLAPRIAKEMRSLLDHTYRFLLERDLRTRKFLV